MGMPKSGSVPPPKALVGFQAASATCLQARPGATAKPAPSNNACFKKSLRFIFPDFFPHNIHSKTLFIIVAFSEKKKNFLIEADNLCFNNFGNKKANRMKIIRFAKNYSYFIVSQSFAARFAM